MRSVIACILVAAALCAGCNKPISGNRMAELKLEGDAVVAAIYDYRARRKHFPESLEDVGVKIETDYGPWDYEGHPDKFFLVVGNHKKHGFMLSWNPNRGEWQEFRSR